MQCNICRNNKGIAIFAGLCLKCWDAAGQPTDITPAQFYAALDRIEADLGVAAPLCVFGPGGSYRCEYTPKSSLRLRSSRGTLPGLRRRFAAAAQAFVSWIRRHLIDWN